MPKRLLPLLAAGLLVQQILPSPDGIVIATSSCQQSASCPECGVSSRRVHSCYDRTLGDLPWQGRPVALRVQARRFRCLPSSCPRRTFTERLAGVAPRSARRTERLGGLQRHLGLALGGEAGARLAERLTMPTSADTLLRMISATKGGSDAAPATRVLAVDDRAWRRGHCDGTILVDLERNQVADRWHLLRNLGMAVQALADRHGSAARQAARQVSDETATAAASMPQPAPPDRAPPAGERRSQASRWKQPQRGSMLDAHEPFLDRRWTEGCHNAAQLWRELVSLGFAGRPEIVRGWAGRRREQADITACATGARAPGPTPPSARKIARLLMSDVAGLPEMEHSFVARLLQEAPGLADAIAVAKRMHLPLRKKSEENLSEALDDAAETSLAPFAAGLRRDGAAVQAALDLPWTTSPAQGQINRLKMLKRTIYGRAGFQLLRARVLHAA